jgi:hypothetical protein
LITGNPIDPSNASTARHSTAPTPQLRCKNKYFHFVRQLSNARESPMYLMAFRLMANASWKGVPFMKLKLIETNIPKAMFVIRKYESVQKLSALYTGALAQTGNGKLKAAVRAIQLRESSSTASRVALETLNETLRRNEVASKESLANLLQLTTAAASLADSLGLKASNEIARFDKGDAVAMAENLAAVFAGVKYSQLANDLKLAKKKAQANAKVAAESLSEVIKSAGALETQAFELESMLILLKRTMVLEKVPMPRVKRKAAVAKSVAKTPGSSAVVPQ